MSNIKLNIPEIQTTTAKLVSSTLRSYVRLQTIEIKAIRVRLLTINRPVCSKTICETLMCVNLSIDNWGPHSRMLLYLHHKNSKLFFHPAKFENFKDYKTASVAQCKNLLDWKMLRALFLCFEGANFFLFSRDIIGYAQKSCTKWSKKYGFFYLNLTMVYN